MSGSRSWARGGRSPAQSGRVSRWNWLAASAACLLIAGSSGCRRANRETTSRVAGMSMAPGLFNGDQICWKPIGTRLPDRLDRVVCQLPSEGVAVKRLIGFGRERICCRSGDLIIDDVRATKSPRQLAELATATAAGPEYWKPASPQWQRADEHWTAAGGEADAVAWLSLGPAGGDGSPSGDQGLFYDDSPWLESERRRLQVVRDVGLSAVIEVNAVNRSTSELVLQVGRQAARLRLCGGGRLACVAGLLDGQFVVAAWPLAGGTEDFQPQADRLLGLGRQLFPAGFPAQWQQTVPVAESSRPVPIRIGVRTRHRSVRFTLSRLLIWRDVHWLPHGNQACWDVPAGHVFVLGDCPAASRDSRQWGPLSAAAVIGRVVAASNHSCSAGLFRNFYGSFVKRRAGPIPSRRTFTPGILSFAHSLETSPRHSGCAQVPTLLDWDGPASHPFIPE